MTTREENKLSMYLTYLDFYRINQAILDAVPQFTGFLTQFDGKVKQIMDLRLIQELDVRGIAVSKKVLREDLTEKALDVAGRLVAFASVTNNAELLEEINYTKGNLDKSADTILRDKCQLVHDKATELLAEVGEYGVTEVMLADLQKAIDDYYEIIPKTRAGIVTRKGSTEMIKEAFAEADAILKGKLDKLVGILKYSDHSFFNKYMSARMIIDLGKGKSKDKTLVSGTVKDFESGLPLGNATVEITGTELVQKTGSDGKFLFEMKTGGVIGILSHLDGYRDALEEDIVVEEGEETVVEVEMEKEE
ncbi:MAG: carboxypeptidase-like regulatory domain-containing protein [Bacteroidales bacterium]